MKIIGLGQYISRPYKTITKGVSEGFRALGHEFYGVELVNNTLSLVEHEIRKIKPDIIFCQCLIDGNQHDIGKVVEMMSNLKKELGFKFIYQEGDYKDVSERVSVDLGWVDLIAFNQDHQLNQHAKKWNIDREKCIVMPYASYILKERPKVKPRYYNPFVFIGTMNPGRYPGRIDCVTALVDNKLPIKVFSSPTAYGDRTRSINVPIYASASISLSYDFVSHIKQFASDRPFIITGAGGFCLAHRAKGLDKILRNKKHAMFFDTPQEAVELYKEWIEQPLARENMQQEAFEFVQEHHTWKNRCGDLIEILAGRKNHITYLYKEIYESK